MLGKAALIRLGQQYRDKFYNRSIGDILTNWEQLPIQITDDGLVIAVDCNQNAKGDCLISEDIWLEMSRHENRTYIHVWNQWGVITPRPIEFKLPDSITPSAMEVGRKAIAEAAKPSRLSCSVLVHRDEVVVAFKQFPLDSKISIHLLNLMFLTEGVGQGDFEMVQQVIAVKNQSQVR